MILLALFLASLAAPFGAALFVAYGSKEEPESEIQSIARALSAEYERRKAEGASPAELELLRAAKMRYIRLLQSEH